MEGYSQKELEAAYNMWEPTGLLSGFEKEEASKLAVQLSDCYQFVEDKNSDLDRTNGYIFPCMCKIYNHTGSHDIDYRSIYKSIHEELNEDLSLDNIEEESEFLNGIVEDHLDD